MNINQRRDLSTVPLTRFCTECQGCKSVPASVAAGFPAGRRPCNCTGNNRTSWTENVSLLQLMQEMKNAQADQDAWQQTILDEKQRASDELEVAAEVAAALAKRLEDRKTATLGFLK